MSGGHASETANFHLHPSRVVDRALKSALLARGPVAVRARSMLTRERYLNAGTVSVVVPFYNVRRYLGAALESLRYQRYFDLEIILVDDGSTDGSVQIAEEFARHDNRFRLVRSTNHGLGAARNLGARHASSRYLMFVDSDDIVPVSAIYRYVASLETTGSDFVVGAVERIRGAERWRPGWVDEVHGEAKLATTLDDSPGVLHNVFVWNKLFRRDFFDAAIGGFAAGVLYEDQVPSARAYTAAKQFDVLAETTYLWRERVGGGSITQHRGEAKNLADRVVAFEEVNQLMAAHASERAYRYWLRKSVFDDLRPFMVASIDSGQPYRVELRRIAQVLWEHLPEADRVDSRPHHDQATKALLAGDFEALAPLLA